jgi:hypothetical protein
MSRFWNLENYKFTRPQHWFPYGAKKAAILGARGQHGLFLLGNFYTIRRKTT